MIIAEHFSNGVLKTNKLYLELTKLALITKIIILVSSLYETMSNSIFLLTTFFGLI